MALSTDGAHVQIRNVEGWRARLVKEEEDARGVVQASSHRRLTDAEKKHLADKYLQPGSRDEAGYARAIAKLSAVKVSAGAKKRLDAIRKRIDQIARREDGDLAEDEKRKERHRWHQKLYREKYPERAREAVRRWTAKNKERVKARKQQWKEANPDRLRAYRKAWVERNRARVAATRRRSVERKRLALMEQQALEQGGALRRLFSQFDGRRLAIDVLRSLKTAGFAQCRANHTAKVKIQTDALIRAWDELALRGSRQAAVGFCVMLTDMIGAKRLRATPEFYEDLELQGLLQQWPAGR